VRSRLAALMLAAMACGTPTLAAGADAPAAPPFEVVPKRPSEGRSHKLALGFALTGVVLVGASFPLAAEGDRRYDAYLAESDVAQIEERFQSTLKMDNYAKASLLVGELLLATAVWMRFVHSSNESRTTSLDSPERLTLDVRPDRCALAFRF
jgi:hypothetical protein